MKCGVFLAWKSNNGEVFLYVFGSLISTRFTEMNYITALSFSSEYHSTTKKRVECSNRGMCLIIAEYQAVSKE